MGETATITGCTVGGSDTGIYNGGTGSITNCTVSGNGNGIRNIGTVNVTGCTVSGNTTGLNNVSSPISPATAIVKNSIICRQQHQCAGQHHLRR